MLIDSVSSVITTIIIKQIDSHNKALDIIYNYTTNTNKLMSHKIQLPVKLCTISLTNAFYSNLIMSHRLLRYWCTSRFFLIYRSFNIDLFLVSS